MTGSTQDNYLKDWQAQEAIAEQMLPVIGSLYRDKNIVTTVYGRSLVHCTAIDILKAHRFARQILDNELSVLDSWPLLEALSRLELAPSRIDLGKLTFHYCTESGGLTPEAYVLRELASVNTGVSPILDEPQDIVLYGFGRIGRLVFRAIVEQGLLEKGYKVAYSPRQIQSIRFDE